jgi:hypothetical protein
MMNSFAYIPDHLCEALFTYFSSKSLSALVKVSKHMGALATEEAFRRHYLDTRHKFQEHFGHDIDHDPAKAHLPARPKEVDLLTECGAYFFLARPGVRRLKLNHAAKSRDPDMIALALETGATDYFAGCISAAKNSARDIAIDLFERSDRNNIPECLSAAYQGWNRDLINYFTALQSPPDWNSAMKGACKGHYPDLIDELFDKYTGTPEDLIMYAHSCVWITKYLVEKKNVVITDDRPIEHAIATHQKDVAYYLIKSFPKIDTTFSFGSACRWGELYFVEMLLPGTHHEIHRGFRAACRYGQDHVMTFLAGKIVVDWNAAVRDVCKFKGHKGRGRLMTLFLCVKKGADLEVIEEAIGEEHFGEFFGLVFGPLNAD